MSVIAYTFNLQHGEGTDALANYSRQITNLAGGDLLGVQERTTGSTGWDASLASNGFAEAVYRENDTSQNDGPAIWYKSANISILKTYQVDLSEGASTVWSGNTNVDKAAVGVKCRAEGKDFYFVSTHLAWSAGADSNGAITSTIRENQIKTLLTWINSEMLGLDVVIAADFNFGPEYLLNAGGYQIDLFLRAGFIDLWREGMSRGIATANWANLDGTGGADQTVSDNTVTHDTRRIDSIYLKTVNRALTFDSIDIPDWRVTCSGQLTGNPAYCPDTDPAQRWGNSGDFGVRPSDHNAVKAIFSVNQQAVSPVRRTNFSWFPNVKL